MVELSGYQRANRTVPWVMYDRVLKEFGTSSSLARRAYTRFVRSGIENPPSSPFAGALEGILLGSDAFIARIRRLLDDRSPDSSIPQVIDHGHRPWLWLAPQSGAFA